MPNDTSIHIATMRHCIELAKEAARLGNYPLGAAVVRGDEILGECSSALIGSSDPTAHPEIIAIRRAAEKMGSRYLSGMTLVTTLEPCPMCASAAIWAKMTGIAFGTSQSTAIAWGARIASSTYTFRQIRIRCAEVVSRGDPLLQVDAGVLEKECDALLALVPHQ